MSDRPCKVCNFSRQKSYGLVVPTLVELKVKGCEFLGFSSSEGVSVVLEEDGTIVEDQAYFLCLPSNTRFMLLQDKDKWSPVRRMDGGTAWMARESVLLETDAVDGAAAPAPWSDVALQLKQDLARVILLSEAELQMLAEAPVADLGSALGFEVSKVEQLQETLQRVLDRREEERQSRDLLQLYLKAVEREEQQEQEEQEQGEVPRHGGSGDADVPDGLELDAGFSSRTLMVLKGKSRPETRLSTEDLQAVLGRPPPSLQQLLGWDGSRTASLLQACEAELGRRLQLLQAADTVRRDAQLEVNQQGRKRSAEEEQEDGEEQEEQEGAEGN